MTGKSSGVILQGIDTRWGRQGGGGVTYKAVSRAYSCNRIREQRTQLALTIFVPVYSIVTFGNKYSHQKCKIVSKMLVLIYFL